MLKNSSVKSNNNNNKFDEPFYSRKIIYAILSNFCLI